MVVYFAVLNGFRNMLSINSHQEKHIFMTADVCITTLLPVWHDSLEIEIELNYVYWKKHLQIGRHYIMEKGKLISSLLAS